MSERGADAERRADTERRSSATRGLDLLATPALVASLIAEGRRALDAAASQSAAIADAVDAIVARLERGGTLHYVGAGTSGRLGALDAAEWFPTFGVAPGTVRAHIAGGAARWNARSKVRRTTRSPASGCRAKRSNPATPSSASPPAAARRSSSRRSRRRAPSAR